MKLTRLEQETIINFNAGEQTATLYTRDPAVMRKVDALVIVSRGSYRKKKKIGEKYNFVFTTNIRSDNIRT